MKNNEFTVIYTKEKNWVVARCLEIDVVSQGKTQKSAEKNIKEAIRLYIESFGDQQIPEYKSKPVVGRVNIPGNESATQDIRRKADKVFAKAKLHTRAAKRKSRIAAKTYR